MSYARTTTVDPSPSGDTVKQAILDVDTDLTGSFTNLNTHEALVDVHGVKVTAGQTLVCTQTTTIPGGFMTGLVHSVTDTNTITLDWSLGATQVCTIGATGRTVAFSSPYEGMVGRFIVVQGSGGSKTITGWPTVKWSGGTVGSLTVSEGKADVFTFLYANGNYYGDISQNF